LDGNDETELARLMRAAIAGDERAYTEFLRRAACLVRSFARRKVVQGGIDPEDIVQETLLAIHMKRHTWRDDAPVTPWLYAIARYKLIDAFRRRGRRVEIEISEITETFAEPEPEPSATGRSVASWRRLRPASAPCCSGFGRWTLD
jgi:RNA polymerase sigma-70 factor (ECF subfamily)